MCFVRPLEDDPENTPNSDGMEELERRDRQLRNDYLEFRTGQINDGAGFRLFDRNRLNEIRGNGGPNIGSNRLYLHFLLGMDRPEEDFGDGSITSGSHDLDENDLNELGIQPDENLENLFWQHIYEDQFFPYDIPGLNELPPSGLVPDHLLPAIEENYEDTNVTDDDGNDDDKVKKDNDDVDEEKEDDKDKDSKEDKDKGSKGDKDENKDGNAGSSGSGLQKDDRDDNHRDNGLGEKKGDVADGGDSDVPREKNVPGDSIQQWLLNRDVRSLMPSSNVLVNRPSTTGTDERRVNDRQGNFAFSWYRILNRRTRDYLWSTSTSEDSSVTREWSLATYDSNAIVAETMVRKRLERRTKQKAMLMVRERYENQSRGYSMESMRAQMLVAELVRIKFDRRAERVDKALETKISRQPADAVQTPAKLPQEQFEPSPCRTVVFKEAMQRLISNKWRRACVGRVDLNDRNSRYCCWMSPIRWTESREFNGGVAALSMAIPPFRHCEKPIDYETWLHNGDHDYKLRSAKESMNVYAPEFLGEETEAPKMDDLLKKASSMDLSDNGELFSVEAMYKIAMEFKGNHFDVDYVKSDLLAELKGYSRDVQNPSHEQIAEPDENVSMSLVQRLMKGHRIAICYDAGENGRPVLNFGRSAQWAVLCGVIVAEKPGVEVANDGETATGATRAAEKTDVVDDEACSNIDVRTGEGVWVVARHCHSSAYAVWPLVLLLVSNRQLRTPNLGYLQSMPPGYLNDWRNRYQPTISEEPSSGPRPPPERRRPPVDEDRRVVEQTKERWLADGLRRYERAMSRSVARRMSGGGHVLEGPLDFKSRQAAVSWRDAIRTVVDLPLAEMMPWDANDDWLMDDEQHDRARPVRGVYTGQPSPSPSPLPPSPPPSPPRRPLPPMTAAESHLFPFGPQLELGLASKYLAFRSLDGIRTASPSQKYPINPVLKFSVPRRD